MFIISNLKKKSKENIDIKTVMLLDIFNKRQTLFLVASVSLFHVGKILKGNDQHY